MTDRDPQLDRIHEELVRIRQLLQGLVVALAALGAAGLVLTVVVALVE